MLNAIIIDRKETEVFKLREQLNKVFPHVECGEIIHDQATIIKELHQPNNKIFFINPSLISPDSSQLIRSIHQEGKSVICINKSNEYSELAFSWNSIAYLKKPFEIQKVTHAVKRAKEHIEAKVRQLQRDQMLEQLLNQKQRQNLLGVPTIKGFEIIEIHDIMRCEGLQKCTKIITKQKGNIVSSYSIGMFKSLLEPYDIFFFPHRSHIINLQCVKSYQKCGLIILKNNESVPISKRHRQEFLDLILHI